MPKPIQFAHIMHSKEAARSQQLLRRLRETYVPSRIKRILREECTLMLRLDTSKSIEEMLKIHSALLRQRLLIFRCIGWPKEPGIKMKIPNALNGTQSHDPLGDIDVEAMVQASTEPEVTQERA